MSAALTIHDVRAEFEGGFHTNRSSTSFIVVHHAAALYPQRLGLDDCRAVARYHIGKGWSGIGYHWGLAEETPGGPIGLYLFSDPIRLRAHVAWRNHECFGISCLTNFDKHPGGIPEQRWIDALAAAIQMARTMFSFSPVVGHKEVALARAPDGRNYSTSCPGTQWAAWRSRVLGGASPEPPPPPSPTPTLTRWRVAATNGVNILDGASAQARKRGAFVRGTILTGEVRAGTAPAGATESRWLKLSGQPGYAWLGALERAA